MATLTNHKKSVRAVAMHPNLYEANLLFHYTLNAQLIYIFYATATCLHPPRQIISNNGSAPKASLFRIFRDTMPFLIALPSMLTT